MKTLYVTDLDGTLLNKQRKLSTYTTQTVNTLIKEGLPFTYATARSLTSAKQVAADLEIELPIITNNGTFLVNPKTGEKLQSNFFSKKTVQEIRKIMESLDANPLVYSYQNMDCEEREEHNIYDFHGKQEKISWITGRESEGLQYYCNLRKMDKRMRRLNKEASGEELYAGDIFYFNCIAAREELLPVYQAVKDRADVNCIFHQELYRPEYWCEIMPRNATKANAMLELKSMYGFDKVVCFGDEANDIAMFESADEGYAMENAVDRLKAVATEVIGKNDEDGVVKWLLTHAS